MAIIKLHEYLMCINGCIEDTSYMSIIEFECTPQLFIPVNVNVRV